MAKQAKIAIDTSDIKQTGARIIEKSRSDPEAWDAALAFLDYRSFLASISFTLPAGEIRQISDPVVTHYDFGNNMLNFGKGATLATIGLIESADLPQIHQIFSPDENAGAKRGPIFLLLTGADLVLDNLYLKKLIIVNSHIIYRGGPITLENVSFINCTFEIDRRPAGQSFAGAVLESSPAMTFGTAKAVKA